MSDSQQVTGISDSTQGVANALGAESTGSFWDQLQQASFRGVPFGVSSAGGQAGRRNANHEYPFRDVGWSEDLGRARRRFQITGFVNGDDVIAQRERMLDAVEAPGDGELVHPTMGRIQVSLNGFDWEEIEGKGRTIVYRFQFIRQGKRQFPSSAADGTAAVASASALLGGASAAAFVAKAQPVLANGAAVISQAGVEAGSWGQQALQVGNDATTLVKLAVSLPGQFGRLLGLASGVAVGEVVPTDASLTIADLVSAAAVSRAAISAACGALSAAAAQLSTGSIAPFTDAAQGVVDAILDAASTPGDALRGLATLAGFIPAQVAVGDELVVQGACADLFRRLSLSSMAQASASYQPQSSGDAAAVRGQVLDVLDREVTVAGDQFEDDVYTALRALRAQVVQDLNTRGAQLPTLVTVSFAAPLPALALAQRLYRDPARADELVSRADPVHPAFMPRSFSALNA